MPIVLEGDEFVFSAPADSPLPAFRCPSVAAAHDPATGRLVAGVWRTSKVPYVAGDVAYYLCEGVKHPTKAEYEYWHMFGLAGCVLRQHLRQRLGLLRDPQALLAALFPEAPAAPDFLLPTSEEETTDVV